MNIVYPQSFWRSFLVVSGLVISILNVSYFVAANALAQAEVEPSIIADVNLVNQVIVKQEGRNVTLGVNIQNKIGTQAGVMYGVQAFQTVDGNLILVDEFATLDSITIKQNQYAYREFEYQLPLTISGKIELVAFLKTDKGILLSAAPIKTVEVAAVSVPVDISDCALDVNLKTLKCTFNNKTSDKQTIVLTTLVKSGDSVFAPVVQTLVPQEIVFDANETKEIVQNIDELIFLRDAFFETTITDLKNSFLISRATTAYESPVAMRLINNMLINQTSAENYDIQLVSLSSGITVQAEVTISGTEGVCASQKVTVAEIITSTNFVLEKACDTILVSVNLIGEDGVVIDRFETEHQTLFPQTDTTFTLKNNTSIIEFLMVIVSALLLLVLLCIVIKKRQNQVNIKA